MKFFGSLNQLIRMEEWYDSKVPLLLMPALYAAFMGDDVEITPIKILLLLMFDGLFLAYGYLINDYADIETDKKAGKDKLLHHMPGPVPLLLVYGSVILGCIPVMILSGGFQTGKTPQVLLALAVIYFFGGSYSAAPLRFKERGVLGLIVSAAAQRCFPLVLLPILFGIPVDVSLILWIVLGFFVGIRYILVHQYVDAENDRRSGVETFALHHQRAVGRLIRISFTAELIIDAALLVPVCRRAWWVILFLAGYFLLSMIRQRGCRMVFGHGGLLSFDQVPLEDFYNHYLPLIFIILLMGQDMVWGILLLLWVLILFRPAIRHLKFPVKIARDRCRRVREERE